jgi:hypothetical protein
MVSSSSARLLAERIFADEEARLPPAEEAVSAVKAIHEKLARVVAAVVGEAGFNAMFARTLRKMKPAHLCLATLTATQADVTEGLWSCLGGQGTATVRTVAVALLDGFLTLLSTFIGDELTLRLFLSTWPDAVASALATAEKTGRKEFRSGGSRPASRASTRCSGAGCPSSRST